MKSLIAAFLEKMPFWKRKMKPQINEDFTLLDSDDGFKTGIGILKGTYQGVLYHYGKVRISEEDDHAKMTFAYTIISSPQIPIDDLTQDPEFHTLIGDILTEILTSKNYEAPRDYDPEEFDI
jgi:hypothetical protein